VGVMSENSVEVSPTGSSSPPVREKNGEGPLEDVAAYIEKEITSSWQRKTALETRSFALVTMNLGVATLFCSSRAVRLITGTD